MAGSPAGAAGAGSAGVANAGSAAASMPLASALAGGPVNFINADVALDGEPVVGSFTVDGLTFAVTGDGSVELVGAGGGPDELALPGTISFEGIDYALTSIAPYAFYLSGVTSVELPATVTDVDDRAFRSSDVSSVEVDPLNESFASFDGILYDADLTRLLLIPGGRTGAARISDKAEEVDAAAFSHCAGVTAISVDAGSDHLSSWDGLLYDADGTTLLRVPAGATDIAIREGCTTIAAGALEGCASLTTINAPASVTSIGPDVFASVPTVSLPAATLVEDAPQLTALVALSATDDDLPEVDPSAITVNLPTDASTSCWETAGIRMANSLENGSLDGAEVASEDALSAPSATLSEASTSSALDLEGFDWAQRYTPTSGVILMLLDPSTSFWKWSLSLNQSQSTVVVDVRGYNGKGLNDPTTKVTFTVSNFDAAAAYDAFHYYWDSSVDSYGYLYALSAASYNTGKPSYANTWMILSSQFAQSSFTFTCCGADLVTRAGGTPVLGNGVVDCFFKVKPQARPMSTAYAHYFNPAPGTLNGSTAAVTMNCANSSLVVPASPQPPKGYTFKGWYTAPTGGLQVTNGMKEILNWRYFAQYEAIPYPVAFDLGSLPTNDEPGSFSEEGWGTSRTFTVEDGRASIPTPVRAGMRFLGWECDVAGLVAQEGSEWRLNCTLLPDVASPALTARWAYAISVDAPAAVTFGEYNMATGDVTVGGEASSADEELDVDSKKGSPVSFKSASKCDIGIEGISCESREGISLIKAKAGQASDEAVRASDLITMQVGGGDPSSRNAVSFALDDALGKDEMALATAFVIPAGGSLPASFRLNLEENGAYVSDDAAGPEPEPCDLAQLSYAFRAIPYGTGQVDATGACAEDMYIPYDAANPFGLADIKAAANDIASRGYDSQWWWICKHLMYADERGKTIAKVKVGGTYHDVQILGVRQDRLSAPADGREHAGLTFGWKDVYALRQMNPSDSTAGGWEQSTMKGYLHNELLSSLGPGLSGASGAICEVSKRQQLHGGGTQVSSDKVFIPSAYEVYGLATDAGYNNDEGAGGSAHYQYFAQQGAQYTANDLRVRMYGSTPSSWWLRSSYQLYSTSFCLVGSTGGVDHDAAARLAKGVVPCFAL